MSKTILPKGYYIENIDDWSGYTVWDGYSPEDDKKEQKTLTKRCTCGITITMGFEVDASFHSDWCDLREKL